MSALQTKYASLCCSLPHTTKKTKTKTRDRNRNRADAADADAIASRACTGGQWQAERNSTHWAFVIMCKIHHTSQACLPASQLCAVLCTATSGARLQYDRGFRLRPTCVRIYATATVELILFHRSTKSKKPVVCSVANAATLSSLPACCLRVACIKLCVDVGCIFSTYYFPRHTMANATATATTTTLPPQPQPLPHKKLTYHTLPLQCTEPHTHAQTLTHAHHTYLTFRIAFP